MHSNKHIAKVSYPIFLSLLAQNIIQIIDTAFLGRVGEVELGASAIAGLIYVAVVTIGFGFSMGSQILIGRRNGEGNYSKIGEIMLQGILFLVVPAVLLIIVFKTWMPYFIPNMFESHDIANAVVEYLDWRVLGFVFAFSNAMFRAFYVGIARTKVLIWNSITMAVVNVILDYGFIFGNLGLPEMGIAGAAFASVLAELSSTIFFVIFTKKTVDLVKYGFNHFSFQWGVIKKILDISVFMMIQYAFSIGTWMMFFLFIENYMGERSLAVSNIIRSFYMILTIPANALASTTNTLVSNTIGAKRLNEVMPLIKRITIMSFVLILAIILFSVIFTRPLISIYTDNSSLIDDTVLPFWVLLSALPIYSVSCVVFNGLSGTGNTRTALSFEIVTLVFYVTYMSYIIVHKHYDVSVAWTSEHIYWSSLLIFSFLYMRSGKWKNKDI